MDTYPSHLITRRRRQEAIASSAPFFLRPEWGDAMRDGGFYKGDVVLELSLDDGVTVHVQPRTDTEKGAVGILIGASEEVGVELHINTLGEVTGLQLPHSGEAIQSVDSVTVVTDHDIADVA